MSDTPFIFSLTDLRRQEGSRIDVKRQIEAPESFSTDLVTLDGQIDLDLALQSVSEGVLVTGTARAESVGECARCLREVEEELEANLAELFYYPERAKALAEAGDEEAEEVPVIHRDSIDLEPILRDALVGQMPFIPLCEPDCPGLCSVCGKRLADLPADHAHADETPAEPSPLDELRAKLVAEGGE